jgi:predicted RNA polymerase sigma factor
LLDGSTSPGSHPVAAVRGDLLERAGLPTRAAAALAGAADLTGNAQERELLLSRAADVMRIAGPDTHFP